MLAVKTASAFSCPQLLKVGPFVLPQAPTLIHGLSSRKTVKLAAHPDGHHYLALTSNGEVFSWGSGDGGRLGHGDTT